MRNFFFPKKREGSSSRQSPTQKNEGNSSNSSSQNSSSIQGNRNAIDLNRGNSNPNNPNINRSMLPPLPPGQLPAIKKQDSNSTAVAGGPSSQQQLDSSFQQQQLNNSGMGSGALNISGNNGIGGNGNNNNNAIGAGNPNNNNNMESFNKMFANLIPNKAQKVVDNMMVRYEKFKDIIEKQIKPNRFRLSDDDVQKLTISLTEFDEYKRKIEREFREYQHQKQANNGSLEDHLHDIHLNKNLSACYNRVPSLYFLDNSILKAEKAAAVAAAAATIGTASKLPANDQPAAIDEHHEDFPFLLELSRNMKALQTHQEQLMEYLDEVELNLFYQVYFRFHQILEMILDFNKMGMKCEENLGKVRQVRQMNAVMKKNLCGGALEIAAKKKRIDRMARTLQILSKLSSFSSNKDVRLSEDAELSSLLASPSSSFAAQAGAPSQQKPVLLSEEQVRKQLNRIEAFKVLEKKYAKVNQQKEQDVYGDFLDQASAYLRETLTFKEQIRRQATIEQSIDISSIHSFNSNLHNDSSMHFDPAEEEIDESLQVFEWIFSDLGVVSSKESHLISLYMKASNNFDMMRFEVFKNNVVRDVQKFLKHLLHSFSEYCIGLYRANSPQNVPAMINGDSEFAFLNEINDILLMKFSSFFSNVARIFLTRGLSFFHSMKVAIMKSAYIQEFAVATWQSNVLPIIAAISKLQMEVLEMFAAEMLAYLHYTNTETEANLALKITTSNELFSYWVEKFPAYFERTTSTLDFNAMPHLPQLIIAELSKVNRDITQSFDIEYFYMQKSHLHIELFNTFDARQHQLLETSLSKDTWTPTNISYKIYSTLDYFFIRRQTDDGAANGVGGESEDEEVENFNKVRNRIIAGDSEEEEEEDLQDMSEYYLKKPDREYKIQLNKLIFEKENRRFMMTEGFLVFIRQTQRYIGLMWESQIAHSSQQLAKLIAFIRSYNSLARELIVKGKAARFAQMANRINVKNLATSSLNLSFLLKILPKMAERLPPRILSGNPQAREAFDSLARDVENHIEEIFDTITNILKDMVHKSAQAIATLGWHRAQEKINVPLAQTAKIIDSIRTMHNVLEETLNTAELRAVFEVIVSDFTETYVSIFEELLTAQESNRLSEQRQKDEIMYIANEMIEINVFASLPCAIDFIQAIEAVVPLESVPKLEKLKHKLTEVKGKHAADGGEFNNGIDQDFNSDQGSDSESEKKKKNEQKLVVDSELERIQKKFASQSPTSPEEPLSGGGDN